LEADAKSAAQLDVILIDITNHLLDDTIRETFIQGLQTRPEATKELLQLQGAIHRAKKQVPLTFDDCLSDIRHLVRVGEAILDDEFLPPPEVENKIQGIIMDRISSKVDDRSCKRTLLNASKVLIDIDDTFSQSRDGPVGDAFKDGVLDKVLGDAMNKVYDLKMEVEGAG